MLASAKVSNLTLSGVVDFRVQWGSVKVTTTAPTAGLGDGGGDSLCYRRKNHL